MRRRGAFVLDAVLSHGEWGSLHEAHREDRPDQKLLIKELKEPSAGWLGLMESLSPTPRLRAPLEMASDEEGAYLVLEHLPGPNLETARLERYDGRVPLRKALGWLQDLLEALQTLHDQGLIHGDVKPSNLVLDREGKAVLVDLEALQKCDSGEATLATPEYLVGDKALHSDPQRDLHAAALTFGALVTGKILDPANARLSEHDPLIPSSCDELVLRGLGVKERYRSTRQMAAAVQRLLGEQTLPQTTSPPTRLVKMPKPGRKAAVLPLLLALLCYPLGLAAAHFFKAPPPGPKVGVFERTGIDIQEGTYQGSAVWKTAILGRPVAGFAAADPAEGNEPAESRAHWLAAVLSEAYFQGRALKFEYRRELEDSCDVWLVGSQLPDKFAFRVTPAESDLFDAKAPVLARLWTSLIQDTMTLLGAPGSPGNSAGVLALRPWKSRAETLAGGRALSEMDRVDNLQEAFASLKPDLKEDILDSYLPESAKK